MPAVKRIPTFEAGIQFARTEGFISAPETNHAIRAAVDEAIKCRESGEKKVIFTNSSVNFRGDPLQDKSCFRLGPTLEEKIPPNKYFPSGV